MLNIRDEHGKVRTNEVGIMECWKHFQELSKANTENMELCLTDKFEIELISRKELTGGINSMKLGKGPGNGYVSFGISLNF